MSTKPSARPDHRALAAALRRKVLEGPGITSPQQRQAAAECAAGGLNVYAQSGYGELARQIGDAAPLVTDAQVANVQALTCSEKATFEIIMAAAVGAGLSRWQEGMRAFEEATHEAG